MHRRTFNRSIVAVTLATTLVAAGGCTDNPQGQAAGANGQPLEKITYLTSFATFGRDAYAYVAKEKGYFAEAGFDVTIEAGSGTGENLKQVVADKAQFAAVDMTGALLAAGSAKDPLAGFTAVAAIQQRTMAAIITLDGKGINTPKDLEGRKLVDAPGSVVRQLFPTYAQLAKIDESKVEWREAPAAELMKKLADGSTDGIGQFVVGKPTVEAMTNNTKRAVALSYGDYMQDLYGNVLVASSGYAKANPEKTTRFAKALLRGLQDSIADAAGAAAILKKSVPATKTEAAASELTLMTPFVRSEAAGVPVGALDSSRVARNIAVLQSSGQVVAGLEPDQVISFDLLPKA